MDGDHNNALQVTAVIEYLFNKCKFTIMLTISSMGLISMSSPASVVFRKSFELLMFNATA